MEMPASQDVFHFAQILVTAILQTQVQGERGQIVPAVYCFGITIQQSQLLGRRHLQSLKHLAPFQEGAAVALATDFNPGSAPSWDLPLALMLACTLQRMTPAEALKGATIYAARAAGVAAEAGSLEPGKAADFAVIDAPDVNQWLYQFRPNACAETVIGGVTRWRAA